MQNNQPDHQQVMARRKKLEQARITLLKEFIGIDGVINRIMDAVSSWYLFPDIQEKPVIINLWGLTGVGKSSLVKRLAELLSFSSKYLRFDLGEKGDTGWTLKKKLDEMFEYDNSFPVIIGLDEFQHARTMSMGMEHDDGLKRLMWDLLDSGKFCLNRYYSRTDDLADLLRLLRFCLNKGVEVKNGKVITRLQYFHKVMGITPNENPEVREVVGAEDDFIPEAHERNLEEVIKCYFREPVFVRDHLSTMDGQETVAFLNKLMEFAQSPREIDCSKALIFVMGNLDEAYRMSDDYNPDISADEFHEQSLRITITDIKKALRSRFRNEQIARLGNTHVIYPAFSSRSFQLIIDRELEKLKDRTQLACGIEARFDESIRKLLYSEAVFPTQGTRPIFTTINEMLGSQLGRVYYCVQMAKGVVDRVHFSYSGKKLLMIYRDKNGKECSREEREVVLSVENLREEKRDDLQAITAVHEAGHALLQITLMHTLPEYAYSVTADADTGGFVFTKNKFRYVSRIQVLKRLAVMLGGMAAEKFVFGEAHVTSGSESDLLKATGFASDMVKSSGLGTLLGAFHRCQDYNHFLPDEGKSIATEIQQMLRDAETLALESLRNEKELLLRVADYLSDNRMIRKTELKELVIKYGRHIPMEDVMKDGSAMYYRSRLKDSLAEMTLLPGNSAAVMEGFSLNQGMREE